MITFCAAWMMWFAVQDRMPKADEPRFSFGDIAVSEHAALFRVNSPDGGVVTWSFGLPDDATVTIDERPYKGTWMRAAWRTAGTGKGQPRGMLVTLTVTEKGKRPRLFPFVVDGKSATVWQLPPPDPLDPTKLPRP